MINGNDLFICYLKNLGEDHVVDLMRRLRRYILFKNDGITLSPDNRIDDPIFCRYLCCLSALEQLEIERAGILCPSQSYKIARGVSALGRD